MADEKNEGRVPNLDRTAYPSNSIKSKKENAEQDGKKPEIKKIVEGDVRQRKGFGARVREVMVAEDARNVGSYILFDIAIPALKNFVFDSITQGAQRTLFGGSGNAAVRRNGNVVQTPYSKVYSSSVPDPYTQAKKKQEAINPRSNSRFVGDVEFGDREEAVRTLDALTTLIEDFGVARVADLYSMVGITSAFTDNDWGWTNLSSASVSLARGGWYVISFPRPEHLSQDGNRI